MATNDLRNTIIVETKGIEDFLKFTKDVRKELSAIKKVLQDNGFKGNEAELKKAAAAYRREFLKAIKDIESGATKSNAKILKALEAQKAALESTGDNEIQLKNIKIAIEVIKSLADVSTEAKLSIKGLNKEISDLDKEQQKNNKTKKESTELTQEELIAIEGERLKRREATQVAKQQAIILAQEKDTIASLRAQLSLVSLQWSKLTEEEQKSTIEGVKLTAEKKRLTEQLKRLEMATGDARRNVGFYNSALGLLEKTALRVFVGRSIVDGVRNLVGFFGNLVERGKEYNGTLSTLSNAFGKVDNAFSFIGTKILEFFAPAILFVTGLLQEIPAIFGGVVAAAKQFGSNVSASFQILGLNIQRVFQQINKANPFTEQTAEQINANIAAIDAQINSVRASQKGLSEAYLEGYNATIQAQKEFDKAQKDAEGRADRLAKAEERRKEAEAKRTEELEKQKNALEQLKKIEDSKFAVKETLINELRDLELEAIEDVTQKAIEQEKERFRQQEEASLNSFLEIRKQRLDDLAKLGEYLDQSSEQFIKAQVDTSAELVELGKLTNEIIRANETAHQEALQKIKDNAAAASLEAARKAAQRSIEIRREEIAQTEQIWDDYVANNEADAEEQIAKDVENAKKRNEALEGAITSAIQSTFDNVQKILKIAADAENKAFEDAINQRQQRIDKLNEDLQAATGAQRVFLEKQIQQEKAAQKKLAQQAEQARREQAEAQRAVAIVQAIVNTAVAVTQALGSAPPPASFILAGAAGAAGAIEIATIAAQKFQKGGVIEGSSHAQGGVRASVKGAPDVELEGGEIIINKNSARMFRKELEYYNVMGGGRKFQFGGDVSPNFQAIASANNGDQRRVVKEITSTPIVVSVTDITNMQNRVVQVAQKSSF